MSKTLTNLNAKLDKIISRQVQNAKAMARLAAERQKLEAAYDAIEDKILDIEQAIDAKLIKAREKLAAKVTAVVAKEDFSAYDLWYKYRKVEAKIDRRGNYGWVLQENGNNLGVFDTLRDARAAIANGEI